MTIVALACFTFAGLCGIARLLKGPSLADRIMALDVTLISLMGAITIDAARRNDPTNLIALVVLAIVGFTATVAATQYLEHNAALEALASKKATAGKPSKSKASGKNASRKAKAKRSKS